MTTAYSILATITLQHEYYADGRCNDFDIVPSAATAAALKGAAILTKTIGNMLILLVKVDELGASYIDLPADLKLSFYLRLNNPSFINYTNVPYGGTATIFYFTNLFTTTVGSTRYLNQYIPAFDIGNTYAIGDLVQDAGVVFEAIKIKTQPVVPGGHAISDAAFWYARTGDQYVHGGDLLTLTDGLLQVTTAPARIFDITVFSLNTETLLYDVPVGDAMHQEFSEDQKTIIVNLNGIAPGKYKVVVNGREELVYANAAASYAHVFGIIELYNIFDADNDFGLLNDFKHPKGLDHVIRFANRLAIWKYITRTPTSATGIKAGPGTAAFVGPAPQFISEAPIPLKQEPLKLSLMKGADTVLVSRLANPPPERISTYRDAAGNDYYCTEMYLNY